jgi:hypothetical protein
VAETCLNCGEKLLGDFCWRCGQEAADFHRPLRSLAADFLENVLNLDSKLLRTVGPLLFRPGWLTREYLAGRRAPYVRPLKLYLLAALVCFGILAIWPQGVVRVVVKPSEPGSAASQPRQPASERDQIDQRALGALAESQRFADAFTTNLPRAFFLLLPAFALLLALLYPRRGTLYLDHLVFALHFHAFALLVMAVAILINTRMPTYVAASIGVAAWLWIFVYLFLAMRAVYKDPWWKAGLRFAALLVLYGGAFGLSVLGLMKLTIYRLGS